jgi:hypothetical protein
MLLLLLLLLLLLRLCLLLLLLLLLLVLVWQSLKNHTHRDTDTRNHSRYNEPGKFKFFARFDPLSTWDTWDTEALAMMRIINNSQEFWREEESFVAF